MQNRGVKCDRTAQGRKARNYRDVRRQNRGVKCDRTAKGYTKTKLRLNEKKENTGIRFVSNIFLRIWLIVANSSMLSIVCIYVELDWYLVCIYTYT